MKDEHWHETPEREFVANRSNRRGALNVALLFGTAAIALSLIVTPMLAPAKADRLQASTIDYDNITTGSVSTDDGKTKRYTIRRSVLNESPGEVCIIDANGAKRGC